MIRTDLKAASQPALYAALEVAGLVVDGVTTLLDEIGAVWIETGDVEEEGAPVLRRRWGWHANLYTAEPLTDAQRAALPDIPTPATPLRVLAGEVLPG